MRLKDEDSEYWLAQNAFKRNKALILKWHEDFLSQLLLSPSLVWLNCSNYLVRLAMSNKQHCSCFLKFEHLRTIIEQDERQRRRLLSKKLSFKSLKCFVPVSFRFAEIYRTKKKWRKVEIGLLKFGNSDDRLQNEGKTRIFDLLFYNGWICLKFL